MLFELALALTQLAHEKLHLVQGTSRRLDRRRTGTVRKHVRARVVAVRDKSDEHVAAVVLNLPVRELFLNWHAGYAADVGERVVDMGVGADTVLARGMIAVRIGLSAERSGGDLGGNLGESDADGADLIAEDLASVKRFAGRHGIVEALEIDELCGARSGQLRVDASGQLPQRSTHPAGLVGQDACALDRTESREDGQEMVWRRARRDRADPERACRLRLQAEVARTGLTGT